MLRGIQRDDGLVVRDLLLLEQLDELGAELAAFFGVDLDCSHGLESLMTGSLKTEALVLRSMRYGEADRILHLYTPHRGRISAIAKGVRKTRSRFGGRMEPYFRLHMVLYEGRSELLTVTSAETISGHPRLREHAAALDSAAR